MAEYIDREKLLKSIGDDVPLNLEMVLRHILNAPAADVVPVVHGRWYGNNCTACKLPWNYCMVQDADDWGYFDPMPDYCPNCGAKMDGGAGDDANGNG